MKNTYRKIEENWVNLDPRDILWESTFIHTKYYEDCIEKGKSNIEHYVNKNKAMLSLVADGGYGNEYALRQLIYRNSYLSGYTARLQTAGRRYYREEAMKKIKEAIAPVYAKLPEFFRNAYSLDDVARSYLNEATADWTSQINKAATAYFYRTMRNYIHNII
jgi:hypothetical protein